MASKDGKVYRRSGFTLIECLVVISLIGLIAALLLPALGSAREAARRTACRNDLRQIGIAIHSYLTNLNCFPMGRNGRGVSLHTTLLPQLEQSNLFDAINYNTHSAPIIDDANRTIELAIIHSFLCPSDTDASRAFVNNSYAGNFGSNSNNFAFYAGEFEPLGDGVFTFNSIFGEAGITDGMSNTVGMSEWNKAQSSLLVDVRPSTGISPQGLYDLCEGAPLTARTSTKNAIWFWGSLGSTLYDHLMSINGNSCNRPEGPPGRTDTTWAAGSHHGAGVHSLLMDGRVSYISSGIELNVWRSLGTRAGNEIIPIY